VSRMFRIEIWGHFARLLLVWWLSSGVNWLAPVPVILGCTFLIVKANYGS
jgi:hypothetical protein